MPKEVNTCIFFNSENHSWHIVAACFVHCEVPSNILNIKIVLLAFLCLCHVFLSHLFYFATFSFCTNWFRLVRRLVSWFFTHTPTSYINIFFVKCHIFEGDEITNRMQIAWSVEYQFWFRGKILDDLHRKFKCEVEHTLYRLLLLRIGNMHIPLFLSDGVLNFFNDFSEGKTLYNYLPFSSLLHSWR